MSATSGAGRARRRSSSSGAGGGIPPMSATIMEGLLDRCTSNNGASESDWTPQCFRLDHEGLDAYDIRDSKQGSVIDHFDLVAISDVRLVEGLMEVVFTHANRQVKLRAASNELAGQWHRKLQELSQACVRQQILNGSLDFSSFDYRSWQPTDEIELPDRLGAQVRKVAKALQEDPSVCLRILGFVPTPKDDKSVAISLAMARRVRHVLELLGCINRIATHGVGAVDANKARCELAPCSAEEADAVDAEARKAMMPSQGSSPVSDSTSNKATPRRSLEYSPAASTTIPPSLSSTATSSQSLRNSLRKSLEGTGSATARRASSTGAITSSSNDGGARSGSVSATPRRKSGQEGTTPRRAGPLVTTKSTLMDSNSARRKKTTILIQQGDQTTELDPSNLLDSIQRLLKETGIRVSDLFRNPAYNPGYVPGRNETMTGDEVAAVLGRAGLLVPAQACKALIKLMDTSGDDKLDMEELEAALRVHKRGEEIWDRDGNENQNRKSMKDFKRSASLATTDSSTNGAQSLEAIQRTLDERNIRIHDLFRHPRYNPKFLQKGDEAVSAEDFQVILGKAGIEYSLQEIKQVVNIIDIDGNGKIEMSELEAAMRKHRRGTLDWSTTKINDSGKKKVDMDRLNRLYEHGVKKKEILEQMRHEIERQEDMGIWEEKEKARMGSRAHHEARFHADLFDRLHEERKDIEARRVQLARHFKEEEWNKVQETRLRPNRCASDPSLTSRNEGFAHIGERLHALKTERENEKQRSREQVEASLLQNIDTISQEVLARGGVTGDRHDLLYQDAKDRRERRDQLKWLHLEAEAKCNAQLTVGFQRDEPVDMARITELHDEAQHRLAKRQALAARLQKVENDCNTRAAAQAKLKGPESKAWEEVGSKVAQMAPFKYDEDQMQNALGRVQEIKGNSLEKPGFGSKQHRQIAQQAISWCIESVDHALNTVISSINSRTNCQPTELELQGVLEELVDPLKATIQEYRDAKTMSEQSGDGSWYLQQTNNHRLFSDGHLLEDPVGFRQCNEPDMLHQIETDLTKLLALAEKAQARLLQEIGPDENSPNMAEVTKRWPKGSKWPHPRATRKAQFAYNPGPKARERAEMKAFVRYGPATREKRFRHLTDLARVCLVFSDATMLRSGLEQIVEKFEVLDIRNYYHGNNQNLLGQRHVDVLIVLELPEAFICEIRLEEFSFFQARQSCTPHLKTVAQAMGELFCDAGAHRPAVEYLAEWILTKPKESHPVTIFKKHLFRKFGSTVVAWRRLAGNNPNMPFLKFREACQETGQRPKSTEFFQELDATKAGTISLFELDPDATVLLIKFYWRIMGTATAEQLQDPQKLFDRLTSRTIVKLNRPNKMEAHEFRKVARVLGFGHIDADKIFQYLDSHGGEAVVPPATVIVNDLAWLLKLPQLINIECVMLMDLSKNSQMTDFRMMTQSGRHQVLESRRTRVPTLASGAAVPRASSAGAIGRRSVMNIEGISRPSIFARRSSRTETKAITAGSRPGSTPGSAPQSARGSMSARQSLVAFVDQSQGSPRSPRLSEVNSRGSLFEGLGSSIASPAALGAETTAAAGEADAAAGEAQASASAPAPAPAAESAPAAPAPVPAPAPAPAPPSRPSRASISSMGRALSITKNSSNSNNNNNSSNLPSTTSAPVAMGPPGPSSSSSSTGKGRGDVAAGSTSTSTRASKAEVTSPKRPSKTAASRNSSVESAVEVIGATKRPSVSRASSVEPASSRHDLDSSPSQGDLGSLLDDDTETERDFLASEADDPAGEGEESEGSAF